MTLSYTYDGAAVTHKVRPTGIDIPMRADSGTISMGTIPIEDPTATLTLLGHRPFTVVESACAQPRLFTGWVAERGHGRSGEATQIINDERVFETSVVDLNALFGFRIISGGTGNRPSETWDDRMTWLLGSDYLVNLIADTGYVMSRTITMDAADYRGAYPSAVLDDLCTRFASEVNYFAFWDDIAGAVALFCDFMGETILDCTISVSNVEGDPDGATCFAPDMVARMAREPDEVYSEVRVDYANGSVFAHLDSTAAKYIARGTTISRPYTKSATTARSQADAWLQAHAVEVDRITCTIRVPASVVGLIRAGQRMEVRMSHMPGYDPAVWMRIVWCSPKPVDDYARQYDVALELVAGPSSDVPCVIEATPDGYYPPMGSHESDATGNVVYAKAGDSVPIVPEPYHNGSFHFGRWAEADATSKAGFVDGPVGDAGNYVRMLVGGPGVMTVYTRHLDAGTRTYSASLWHQPLHEQPAPDQTWTGWPIGTDLVVDVPLDNYCWHWVQIENLQPPSPGAAGYMGFAGFDWVAGAAPPVVVDGPPVPGTPADNLTATTDPTVTDDHAAGYDVGSHWMNTTTGEVFVLVDATDGAAVWVSTTAAGAPTTADYLVGTAQAGLSAEIVVGTTPGGELGGTWASPTVDATHSGSAHHAHLLNNLAAAVDPAVTDDSGDGYAIGSRWINTTSDEEFVALDVTVGAAVWASTTAGGGGGDASGQFTVGFDGAGHALTAGAQQDIIALFTGTITGWTILADLSGSAVIDPWKDTYGNFPPTVADTLVNTGAGGVKPTLSGALKAVSASVAHWTTAVTAGDVLRFHLDSVSTATKLLLVVDYSRP